VTRPANSRRSLSGRRRSRAQPSGPAGSARYAPPPPVISAIRRKSSRMSARRVPARRQPQLRRLSAAVVASMTQRDQPFIGRAAVRHSRRREYVDLSTLQTRPRVRSPGGWRHVCNVRASGSHESIQDAAEAAPASRRGDTAQYASLRMPNSLTPVLFDPVVTF